VRINLAVTGLPAERADVEPRLKALLESAFDSGPGELNIVLRTTPMGYAVVFARGVFEHAGGVDYAGEVRDALRLLGMAVVDDV
jgi:hypothetical protein